MISRHYKTHKCKCMSVCECVKSRWKNGRGLFYFHNRGGIRREVSIEEFYGDLIRVGTTP